MTSLLHEVIRCALTLIEQLLACIQASINLNPKQKKRRQIEPRRKHMFYKNDQIAGFDDSIWQAMGQEDSRQQ
ncbi:hypothetical protein, partial [Colwellia psychrerythraea]